MKKIVLLALVVPNITLSFVRVSDEEFEKKWKKEFSDMVHSLPETIEIIKKDLDKNEEARPYCYCERCSRGSDRLHEVKEGIEKSTQNFDQAESCARIGYETCLRSFPGQDSSCKEIIALMFKSRLAPELKHTERNLLETITCLDKRIRICERNLDIDIQNKSISEDRITEKHSEITEKKKNRSLAQSTLKRVQNLNEQLSKLIEKYDRYPTQDELIQQLDKNMDLKHWLELKHNIENSLHKFKRNLQDDPKKIEKAQQSYEFLTSLSFPDIMQHALKKCSTKYQEEEQADCKDAVQTTMNLIEKTKEHLQNITENR